MQLTPPSLIHDLEAEAERKLPAPVSMMAVERRQFGWVLLAMLLHACVDLATVVAGRFGGVDGSEVLDGVLGLAMLAFAFRQRPPSPRPATL